MPPELGFALGALATGLVVGWIAGRTTGKTAAHARELAARVEGLRKECELSAAELTAAKAQVERARLDLEQYRARVSEHFAGASDRFRDLSLQYRSLFDHLSEGAGALCGERFTALERDLESSRLPAGPDAAASARGEADAAAEQPDPAH
jgi:uncharacterized membrane-anchored protein YhcB (DUF1043 family)